MNKISYTGGRKFAATILVLGIGGVIVATKGDVPANYLVLLQTALGAFIGGNAVSKVVAAFQGRGGAPAQQEVQIIGDNRLASVEAKLDAQQELLLTVGQSVHAVNEILASARGNQK